MADQKARMKFIEATFEKYTFELSVVFWALFDDLLTSRQKLDSEHDFVDYNRRMAIRNVGSFIDGLVYGLQQYLLLEYGPPKAQELTPEEYLILSEKTYTLNNQGMIQKRDNYTKTISRFKFVILTLMRIYELDQSPDYSCKEFNYLRDTIELRNGIMHPKSQEDLILSKIQVERAFAGALWMKRTVNEKFKACLGQLNKKTLESFDNPFDLNRKYEEIRRRKGFLLLIRHFEQDQKYDFTEIYKLAQTD